MKTKLTIVFNLPNPYHSKKEKKSKGFYNNHPITLKKLGGGYNTVTTSGDIYHLDSDSLYCKIVHAKNHKTKGPHS